MFNHLHSYGLFKLSNLRAFELFDLYSSIGCYILNIFFIVMVLLLTLTVDMPIIIKIVKSLNRKINVTYSGIIYQQKVITEDPMYEFLHSLIPLLIVTSVFAPFYDFLIKKINFFLKLSSDLGINTYKFKLVGNQWYWLFKEYQGMKYEVEMRLQYLTFDNVNESLNVNPFGYFVFTDNPILVGVDTFLQLYLTSEDVIHALGAPALGVKADAIPGQLTFITLKSDFKGYIGTFCQELCGKGHSEMPLDFIFL